MTWCRDRAGRGRCRAVRPPPPIPCSSGPALGQPHALERGAVALVEPSSSASPVGPVDARPRHPQRRVEVVAVVVAVAAIVRAAAAAQAVHRRAARVLAPRRGLRRALVLLLLLLLLVLLLPLVVVVLLVGVLEGERGSVAPGGDAAGAISRRRNRFGLDVQVLSTGQGEIGTLT